MSNNSSIMPLQVRCPKCNKELAAPDELIGKLAACPGCNFQFPVTVKIRAASPSILTRGTDSPPAEASKGALNVTVAAVPSNLPPTSLGPQPPPPPDVRRSQASLTPIAAAPRKQSIATDSTTDAHSAKASPSSSTTVARTTPREATPARFIAATETERIQLGADGVLPELSLQEASPDNESTNASRSGSPFLLIFVLGLSFLASAVLLFLDTESRRAESLDRSIARQQLADYYVRAAYPQKPLEDYQQRLRKALQAHNQGKYADERRYYRQVLNMLRDERLQVDPTAVTGLTGVRNGLNPPSDEHLESLLSQLLSDDGS